jgi:trigger factor
MHIEVNSENSYARKVVVKVPASRVTAELDRHYTRISQSARIPGFRPGRAPRPVLEQRFGPRVVEDVTNTLIQSAWTAALRDHKLQPVSQPRVVAATDLAANVEFTFTIALDVRPTVDAGDYTGLAVSWPAWEVTDDQVASAVESRRRNMMRLAEVKDRAVQAGDVVQIALTASEDGAVVHEAPGTLVRTEGDAWLAGLEGFVLGLSVDEEKSGEVTFSAKARTPALAGKTLQVTVKVLAIQAYVVPELNDALASEMGHATVAELQEATRAQLVKGREEMARNQARANLLQALINANPFDVPASMVEQNLELLKEELKLQQAYAGRDPRNLTFTEAQIADLRMRAAFAAKGALLLDSVATKESIAVTDEDVEAKIVELASMRGQNIEAVRAHFAKAEELSDLKDRILEEKTLDWLLAKATVTQEAPAQTEGEPAVAEESGKKKSTKKKAEAAPAAEADAPAAEESAKKKPAKKKAEAAVEAAPAAEATEEAPAKKRSTKKKADAAEG